MRDTVVLGAQGRLVVPSEARKGLGLAAGYELVLHTEAGRLVLERRVDAGKRLRGLYSSTTAHGAVEELLGGAATGGGPGVTVVSTRRPSWSSSWTNPGRTRSRTF